MLSGKGMWMWIIERCGEPATVAQELRAGGCQHALVKLADGISPYYGRNYYSQSQRDFSIELVEALKVEGVEPIAWQYVYGGNPLGEAEIIVQRMNIAGLNKLVVDAEVEYKAPNMGPKAVQYCQRLEARMPDIRLGLSSYRYPNYHRELPWGEFGQFMECYVPQVYWEQAHNPVEQLGRCLREYQTLPYPNLPIYPAGAAYKWGGWQPAAGEITAFLTAAKDLYGLVAVNFWEWYNAKVIVPGFWVEIKNFAWGEPIPPPEPPPPGDLPEYFIVNTDSLKLRSTPEEKTDNSNFIGWTYRNAKWQPSDIAIDNRGREWWKINEYAYLAKWLTRW